MDTMTIKIGGMSCGHCVGAVSGALKAVEGVQVEQVTVGTAKVAFDPATVSPDRITQAIEDEGYTVAAMER